MQNGFLQLESTLHEFVTLKTITYTVRPNET
jgi:hypothetical protein